MKNILSIIAVFFITAPAYAQVQEIKLDDGYVVYKTAKEGNVEANLVLRDTEASDVNLETLMTIMQYTTSAISMGLKSSRSFVPLTFSYKFKPNKKGKTAKNKHSLHMIYEGTNSYGAAVENTAMLEFNAKLKETAGSVMLRMN
jgi:hypothetical protein